MNENITLSNYCITIRVGFDFQYIDLDVFAAICDRFLYQELIDLLAQSPTNEIFYSSIRNKVKFVIHVRPKED